MKKLLLLFSILMFYLGCSPLQKNVVFANASDEQIIEWGKQYVIHSIEDSLKEGESYKIMEWILAEKRQVFLLRYGKWIIHIKKIQYQDASSY